MRSGFAEELAGIIGADATLALIEARAGLRVHVPKNAGLASGLLSIIGAEATAKLCESFGGLDVKIPREAGWRIRLYRARGHSYSEIAVKVGVSEMHVWRVLREAKLTNREAINKRAAEHIADRRKVAAHRRQLAAAEADKAAEDAQPSSVAADARALRYRRAGMSYAEIGVALGRGATAAKAAV
jgi:DNA-binding CsgD family transcriptional regulator